LKRRFIQCDVFADTATRGNGLAVVVDGDGLSDAQMQAFAAWTNLAETTFLFPTDDPKADYSVRIFTPGREMPFAGHPTLGSCAAWLASGGTPKHPGRVMQECGVGLVEIDISGEVPAFVAPPTAIEPLPDAKRQRLIEVLGLSSEQVLGSARLNNGPVWDLLELRSSAEVLNIDASRVTWPDHAGASVVGAYPAGAECAFEVRMLAPSSGMSEDPITGSLNSAIACWLAGQGRLPGPITMSQGTRLGRQGRVFITPTRQPDRIMIGGHTTLVIQGSVDI
jgi:PhzF family phenazine biosynthesis protein